MPKRKSKKHRYETVSPSHRDAVAPAEIELLHTRALLAVRNFTHYGGGDKAIALMDQLCREYKFTQKRKEYKYAVWKRLQEAVDHVKAADGSKEMQEKLKAAIKEITPLVKKYGYKKPKNKNNAVKT